MKPILARVALFVFGLAIPIFAATPEEEKAFLESYKKAFEANDVKALDSFLHTEGADATTIDFFKSVQRMGAGQKISSIEFRALTADDAKNFNTPMPLPDGKMVKLPFAPHKQLIIVVEKVDGNSRSKVTNFAIVAEKDGKLVVLVPVPAT